MKLGENERKQIIMMLETGEFTQKEVAEKYGVGASTIHKIYHANKTGVIEETSVLDVKEIELINKTLMEENKKLKFVGEKIFKENTELEKANEMLKEDNDKLRAEALNGYNKHESVQIELSPNAARMKFYFDKMLQIYIEKNKKYGNSFSKTYQEYGNIVLLLRIEDKLARAKQLLINNEAGTADESVIDTLIDLANYAIMSVMEIDK